MAIIRQFMKWVAYMYRHYVNIMCISTRKRTTYLCIYVIPNNKFFARRLIRWANTERRD
jgi:hypothetical protein